MQAVACALAGFALSYAISLGSALRFDASAGPIPTLNPIPTEQVPKAIRRFAQAHGQYDSAGYVVAESRSLATLGRSIMSGIEPECVHAYVELSGWPAKCSRSISIADPAGNLVLLAGTRTGKPTNVYTATGVLPTQPLYFGLAINTVFWGLLVAMLLLVIRAIRNARKQHKQLCIKCGYDLTGLNERCPECGNEFTPRTS